MSAVLTCNSSTTKGPFKYYVIKEVGGWGQKMAIFDDLQYCKSSKRWVGLKKSKNDDVILVWSLMSKIVGDFCGLLKKPEP